MCGGGGGGIDGGVVREVRGLGEVEVVWMFVPSMEPPRARPS